MGKIQNTGIYTMLKHSFNKLAQPIIKTKKPVRKTVETIPISKGLVIREFPGKCTKVCFVCGGEIPKGMFAVGVRETHKSIEGKKHYSRGCAYMHIDCVGRFKEEISETVDKNEKKIQDNKEKTVAEQL